VAIDALDNGELNGKVVQIVSAADPASRTFLVKIELPADPRLRSGLFGPVQFSRGERQALLIPCSAVVERGQLQSIYVLDQNKVARLRYITESSRRAVQVSTKAAPTIKVYSDREVGTVMESIALVVRSRLRPPRVGWIYPAFQHLTG